jgi:hypothetical protein
MCAKELEVVTADPAVGVGEGPELMCVAVHDQTATMLRDVPQRRHHFRPISQLDALGHVAGEPGIHKRGNHVHRERDAFALQQVGDGT